MKPFVREENNNIVLTKPFTYEKEEGEKESLIVEIVRPIEEQKAVVSGIPQEEHEAEQVKPFERVDPMIAAYSTNICKQHFGESSVEVESEISQVLTKYFNRSGIILQNVQESEQSHLLNFHLALKKKIIHVQDTEHGEVKKYAYQIAIQVTQKNGIVKDFEEIVPGEKVKKFDWVTKATQSLATIPCDKDSRLEWNEKVQCCIESNNVPFEVTYPNAGWREIAENTWRYVYSEGVVGYENMDVDRAGFPIKFVLGVVGVTNSRKTSLVQALCQIFDRENFSADAEFATATRCGIEKTLSTYKDGVVIIDDFKPGINNGQQNELNRKLDELVRMNGDRVPKKRMTDFLADGDNKFFPISGGCVLTMELVTGVTSSITRMFLTELGSEDVQNSQLSFFQQERWVLDTHLYDFIMWLTNHFDEIINYLKNRIPQLRSERLYTIGRYDEMRSYFLSTAEIFSQYARERNFWCDAECTSFLADVKTAIQGEIFSMQQYIRRADKGILILRALDEILKRGKIQAKELNEDTCVLRCEMYKSEDIIYAKASTLFTAVKNFLLQTYSSIDLINQEEMISALERLDAIDIAVKDDGRRERSRKLPIQRGNSYRYLYIKKRKMAEVLEE